MGTWEGHVLPGSFFISFAVWWALRLGGRARLNDASLSAECRAAPTLYLQDVVRLPRGLSFPVPALALAVMVSVGAVAEWYSINYMHIAMVMRDGGGNAHPHDPAPQYGEVPRKLQCPSLLTCTPQRPLQWWLWPRLPALRRRGWASCAARL